MTSPKLRILYIGSVEMSAHFLAEALRNPAVELAGLVTKRKSSFNSDHLDLSENVPTGTPVFYFENNQKMMTEWALSHKPDVIYCFGWSHLLPSTMFQAPRLGTVAFHPAPLPRFRGRHPLIWAVALGLRETAVTFFKMGEGADDGDIFLQASVPILETDYAWDLYQRVTRAGVRLVGELTEQLVCGTLKAIPQNEAAASYWRKRSAADGRIDWRMSAQSIDRLVRALSSPYPGAEFEHQGTSYKVMKSRLLEGIATLGREPGYIISASESTLQVMTGDGVIEVAEISPKIPFKPGDYL